MTRPTRQQPLLLPLRTYQVEAARAITRSVTQGLGRTITIEVARQGGKNELSSQVELFLLMRALNGYAEAVKTAPTFRPQLRVSMRRLWNHVQRARLEAIAREEGAAINIGHARILFLSADPAANVVGHTASLLLEVDEAQDVDIDKFDREFRPMAATSNATTVLYGTAWLDNTLLERTIQANLAAERRDGERRHFAYDWTVIAAHSQQYRTFVESERARLGESHPAFLTQYALKTISGGGRMFTAAQRAQMTGWHERLRAPIAGETYVAGLDLAGGAAVDASDAAAPRAQPARTTAASSPSAASSSPIRRPPSRSRVSMSSSTTRGRRSPMNA